jgi:hypothetical protein
VGSRGEAPVRVRDLVKYSWEVDVSFAQPNTPLFVAVRCSARVAVRRGSPWRQRARRQRFQREDDQRRGVAASCAQGVTLLGTAIFCAAEARRCVFLPGMGSVDVGWQRWKDGRGPVGRVPRCKARLRWSPELECPSGDDSATVAGPGHRTLGQSEQRGLRRRLTSPTAWRVTWAKGELGSPDGTLSADSPQRMFHWADAWRAEVSGRDAECLGHGTPPCSRALLHFVSVRRDHDGRRVAVRHPATVRRCCAWQRSDR